MAVQTLKIVVCDKCGSDGGTDRYTVVFPTGNRRTFDLCGTCAEPLADLTELAVASGRGPKGHSQPVRDEAEIERMLRSGARKARSRR